MPRQIQAAMTFKTSFRIYITKKGGGWTVRFIEPEEQASIAVFAAKNSRNWGELPAKQYAVKRGCPLRLFEIALECEYERP